jgi:hypothetical protein
MTIEHSLRRRAAKARVFAVLCLTIAVIVLVGTYLSLPAIAGQTLNAISKIEGASPTGNGESGFANPHVFTLLTLGLGVIAISCASFLLGRYAMAELASAGRLGGIADALCVSGNEFAQFEKAAAVFVPKLQAASKLTAEDVKEFAELAKKIR